MQLLGWKEWGVNVTPLTYKTCPADLSWTLSVVSSVNCQSFTACLTTARAQASRSAVSCQAFTQLELAGPSYPANAVSQYFPATCLHAKRLDGTWSVGD